MNIFGIGTWELLLIVIVALLVFGPRRLPEIARTLGKTYRQLRNMSQEFTAEWQEEIAVVKELGEETRQIVEGPAKAISDISEPLMSPGEALGLEPRKKTEQKTERQTEQYKDKETTEAKGTESAPPSPEETAIAVEGEVVEGELIDAVVEDTPEDTTPDDRE